MRRTTRTCAGIVASLAARLLAGAAIAADRSIARASATSPVDADGGGALADWLTPDTGRAAIRQFRVAGEPAYVPVGD